MEDKSPPIRNVLVDGDIPVDLLVGAIKTCWPDCIEVWPLPSRYMCMPTIYRDLEARQIWEGAYDEQNASKDASNIGLARNYINDGWIWVISFSSCDARHVVSIVESIMSLKQCG